MFFSTYLTLYQLPSGYQLIWSPLWSTMSWEPSSHNHHSSTCSPAQLKSDNKTKNMSEHNFLPCDYNKCLLWKVFLTFGSFINHQFVFDEFSEDFVAASVFEAGDGGEQAHWNNLMVLHPHFNLFCYTCTRTPRVISGKLGEVGLSCNFNVAFWRQYAIKQVNALQYVDKYSESLNKEFQRRQREKVKY